MKRVEGKIDEPLGHVTASPKVVQNAGGGEHDPDP
jgi:hypothetical protein